MMLNTYKKKLTTSMIMTGFILLAGTVNTPNTTDHILSAPMTAYAAGQTLNQSPRWQDLGNDIWKVRTQDGKDYLKNTWFEDLDGEWYMLDAEGVMYAGLITDDSTGKTYLLDTEHIGYYGRMLHRDGVYNVNGRPVSIRFNQAHDGSFGAILSDLEEVRSTGVKEQHLSHIPTDSASDDKATPQATSTQDTSSFSNSDNVAEYHDSTITADGTVIAWDDSAKAYVKGYYNQYAEFIKLEDDEQHPYITDTGLWFDLVGTIRPFGDTSGAEVGPFYVNETNNFMIISRIPIKGYIEYKMNDEGIITSRDGLINFTDYCLYTNHTGAGSVNVYMKKKGRGESFYFDDRGWYTAVND